MTEHSSSESNELALDLSNQEVGDTPGACFRAAHKEVFSSQPKTLIEEFDRAMNQDNHQQAAELFAAARARNLFEDRGDPGHRDAEDSLQNRVDLIASDTYEEFREAGLDVDRIPIVFATRDVMKKRRGDHRRRTSREDRKEEQTGLSLTR